MADLNITVDGKKITQPAGTLLIEACKSAGIEIPSFCYYPGLSLQGACRMCLVEIAKMPKLQTACTTFISDGMAVTTQSETVKQARKAMLEFVLQNHPLDCPVCDAGGQCELQAPFLVVQDLFLTEKSQLADVVLPATCAYEKSGTSTNTCGDLQRLRKAAEVVGPKSDLQIIARLAHDMGCPIGKLVTRGEGVRADTGQSRGVQSGEVDR